MNPQEVFIGRLEERTSSLEGRLIVTRYTFQVERSFRGDMSRAEVILHEYGGTVEGVTMSVSHQPHYRVGRSYLIFAKRDPRLGLRTLAGEYGHLEILTDRHRREVLRISRAHPVATLLDSARSFVSRGEVERALQEAYGGEQ